MPEWDPVQYSRFSDQRLRPALDLLGRVPLNAANTIVDLGCGSGAVFEHLRARFPGARLIGVDASPEMLSMARGADQLIEADMGEWSPDKKVDLIYSNAALHWNDDHASLLPRLMAFVRPGGVLAVQMPRNHDRPSHRAIAEVVRAGPWSDRLAPILAPREWPVAEPAVYYDLLRPHVARLDLWETDYIQELPGDDPVVEWTSGTALRPFLDALTPAETPEFLTHYRTLIRGAYPPQPDGGVLLPFRRLFFVAVR